MNTFILWAIAKLTRQSPNYPRLLTGGLIMALMYLLTMIYLPFSYILSALSSLAMISAGITIALKPKTIQSFIKQLLIGYICSFTLGGLGMTLLYRLADLTWTLLIVCVIIAYILIKIGIRLMEGITIKRQMLCPITIYIGDSELSLQALVDTGHSLVDPLNKAPVIIAEFDSIKNLLPDGIKLMFYEQQENDLPGLISAATGNRFYERIRMIPFVSLGMSEGMLIGFRPDRVSLSGEREKKEINNVVIGIYNRKLTGSGQYQGLISPELVA